MNKRYYITLTDENGIVIDRFRVENDATEFEMAGEDCEYIGAHVDCIDMTDRINRLVTHNRKLHG